MPDPFVSFGWNASGNPLPGAGLGSAPVANIGAMVSQEVPYPGKLRLRGEIASKEAEAEAQQYRATALNVISRLKQAYHRLHHAYEMTDLLERNRELLRSLLRTTEARYSVGKAPQADVFRAQTQLTLIETRLIQIEREKRTRSGRDRQPSEPARRTRPLGRPAEGSVEPLTFTVEDLLAQGARSGPRAGARTEDDGARRLGAEPGAKRLLSRLRPERRLLLHGQHAADVHVPRRREAAVAPGQDAGRSYGTNPIGRRGEARLTKRRRDRSNTGSGTTTPMAQTAEKLMKLYSGTLLPQARLTVESSLAAYSTGTADFASVLANLVAVLDYEMGYHEQMQELLPGAGAAGRNDGSAG